MQLFAKNQQRLFIDCIILIFSIFLLLWVSDIKSPHTAYEHYQQAKWMSDKDTDKAIQITQKAISLDPNLGKAYIQLGYLYTLKGETIPAIDITRKAIPLLIQDACNLDIAYWNLGHSFAWEHRLDESWDNLQKSLTINSCQQKLWHDPKASDFVKAALKKDRKAFDKAVSALKFSDEMLVPFDELKDILYRNKPKSVIEKVTLWIDRNPGARSTCKAYEYYALAYWRLNDFEKVKYYLDLLSQEKDYNNKEWLKQIWVWYYTEMKDYDKAWTLYKEAWASRSDKESDKKDLLDRMMNITDSADERIFNEFQKWNKLDKEDYNWMLFSWAEGFYENKQYEKSLQILDEIKTSIDPKYVLSLRLKIYEDLKDVPSQIKTLKSAIAEETKPAKILQLVPDLIYLHVEQGDLTQAWQVAKKYSYIYPIMFFTYILILIFTAVPLCIGIWGLSVLFFRRKHDVVKYSPFRLWHMLTVFCIFTILPSILFFVFLWMGSWLQIATYNKIILHPSIVSAFVNECLVFLMLLWILKKKYGLSNKYCGFVNKGIKYNLFLPLLFTFLGFALAAAFFSTIERFTSFNVPDNPIKEISDNIFAQGIWSFDNKVMLFLLVGMIGPILEEILFRVFTFNIIQKYTNFFWGVLISSLLFAIGHGWHIGFIFFFLMGLMLAWIYRRTKSIIPAMVTHIMYNSIIYLFWILGK